MEYVILGDKERIKEEKRRYVLEIMYKKESIKCWIFVIKIIKYYRYILISY